MASRYLIATVVFFIVIIVGYVKIFTPERPADEKVREKVKERKKEKVKNKKSDTEWKDVGEEFKMMVMDVLKSIRRSVNKKK